MFLLVAFKHDFAMAVGPMVEEAIYINEVLNQMRTYLALWASNSEAECVATQRSSVSLYGAPCNS